MEPLVKDIQYDFRNLEAAELHRDFFDHARAGYRSHLRYL